MDDTQVKVPREIHAWEDRVGSSFSQATESGIADFNHEGANFASVYEDAAMVLQRSIIYSSREGEIRSLTVSA